MNNTTKAPVDIKDISFGPMDEATKTIIASYKNNLRKSSLKKRTFCSFIIIILLMVFEIIGRILMNKDLGYNMYKINTAIYAFIFIFIIFNIVSFIFYFTKGKLEDIAGDTYVVKGQVSRLLGKKQVHAEALDSYSKRLAIWKEEKAAGKKEPKPVYHRYGSFDGSNLPNYLFFKTSDQECSTALDIKDSKKFNSLSVGDNIIVIRFTLNDITQYDIYKL